MRRTWYVVNSDDWPIHRNMLTREDAESLADSRRESGIKGERVICVEILDAPAVRKLVFRATMVKG